MPRRDGSRPTAPLQLRRRALLGAAGASLALPARAGAPEVRLGVLQFGTVQWVADVLRRHALDGAGGFTLSTVPLANTDAGRVAMMAGSADVVVSDWPFVASQRGAGTRLCFAPFSSASGGIMARRDSTLRTLADLKGRKLGVAGGPADKSWLVVQAAARAQGIDLVAAADVVYGAPPLVGAKLEQGELDAVLTFWNFAARLEAAGFREVISVGTCAAALGLPSQLDLVGFVFREDWARASGSPVDRFLAAIAEAQRLLIGSDAEWAAIRPLMGAPDDALFARMRARFSEGAAVHADPATEERDAGRLFAIIRETGGPRATGGLDALPPGIFWRSGHEAG